MSKLIEIAFRRTPDVVFKQVVVHTLGTLGFGVLSSNIFLKANFVTDRRKNKTTTNIHLSDKE